MHPSQDELDEMSDDDKWREAARIIEREHEAAARRAQTTIDHEGQT